MASGATKYLCDRIDAFDVWAIRKILRIPCTRHMTNIEVWQISGCQPLFYTITDRRLHLFGHIIRSSPNEDHHRSVASAIQKPPSDWKWPKGKPSHTWLRAIEVDLKPLNIGLSSVWKKATIRETWRSVWTRQCSRRVRHEKKKKVVQRWTLPSWLQSTTGLLDCLVSESLCEQLARSRFMTANGWESNSWPIDFEFSTQHFTLCTVILCKSYIYDYVWM